MKRITPCCAPRVQWTRRALTGGSLEGDLVGHGLGAAAAADGRSAHAGAGRETRGGLGEHHFCCGGAEEMLARRLEGVAPASGALAPRASQDCRRTAAWQRSRAAERPVHPRCVQQHTKAALTAPGGGGAGQGPPVSARSMARSSCSIGRPTRRSARQHPLRFTMLPSADAPAPATLPRGWAWQ